MTDLKALQELMEMEDKKLEARIERLERREKDDVFIRMNFVWFTICLIIAFFVFYWLVKFLRL